MHFARSAVEPLVLISQLCIVRADRTMFMMPSEEREREKTATHYEWYRCFLMLSLHFSGSSKFNVITVNKKQTKKTNRQKHIKHVKTHTNCAKLKMGLITKDLSDCIWCNPLMDSKSAFTLSYLRKTDLEREADKETYFTRINPLKIGLCYSNRLISERECSIASYFDVLGGG